ncbi:MAG: TonB-dependent receptor [Ignavibacteriae bacterium]|nr:MAG: TonB-dependent receptor [Ignavibacteriota bacterium]
MLFKLLQILFFILFGGGILLAQGMNGSKDSIATNEILVTANRIHMSVKYSPNKIQLLNEDFIAKLNGSRLSDALSFSDAVFIKDYGSNSGLKTISLNSTQSEQTVVLLDGVKLNNNQHSQFDFSLLPLDDISRIEVSKGGSSALYGSEAIGGVINIITKENNNKRFSAELKTELGSFGLKKFYIKGSQNINKWFKYKLSFTNEAAPNEYDYYFFDGFSDVVKQRKNADYKTSSLNLDFDLKPDLKSSINVFTIYNFFERGLPGAELGSTSSPARRIDRDVISSASYSRIFNSFLNLKSNISYKYSLMSYYDTSTFNLSAKLNSFYKLNSYIHSSSLSYAGEKGYEINTGYEISHNQIRSNETEEGKLFQAALFAAGKFEFNKDGWFFAPITLYPSVRYDYYSNISQKNVITGKLGLNVQPFGWMNLTLKSSIGNNFRAPNFNELYWLTLGNKNLLPERSISFDAGLYYSFDLLGNDEVEFSYFYIDTKDRIIWKPGKDNLWRPINIDRVKSEGIDASLKSTFDILERTSISASVNYNYGTAIKKNSDFPGDPAYNKQLIYIPQEFFKSSLGFSYLPKSKIVKLVTLQGFYTFTGKRYTDFNNSRFVPFYELIDVNAGIIMAFFKTDVSLKFAVNNIVNEKYEVIAGYPMPLRNYKIQIGIKY